MDSDLDWEPELALRCSESLIFMHLKNLVICIQRKGG